ncbi:hypothetical protein JHK85_045527 [Glycine max]|nr:hypothetical protein JHK85_045527 [Glycine max]
MFHFNSSGEPLGVARPSTIYLDLKTISRSPSPVTTQHPVIPFTAPTVVLSSIATRSSPSARRESTNPNLGCHRRLSLQVHTQETRLSLWVPVITVTGFSYGRSPSASSLAARCPSASSALISFLVSLNLFTA